MVKQPELLQLNQSDDKLVIKFWFHAIMTLTLSLIGHNVSYFWLKFDRYGV